MPGHLTIQKDGEHWCVVGSAGGRWGRSTEIRTIQRLAYEVSHEIRASITPAPEPPKAALEKHR